MPVDSSLLVGAHAWISSREDAIRDHGLNVEVNDSLPDRDKQSIQWILEGPERMGEIILWETGEAELSFAAVESGEIRPEHRDIETLAELDAAMLAIYEWVIG